MDGEKIKVLLVHSQQLLRQGLGLLMASERDIRVVGQAGGKTEAIAMSEKTAPDCVVVDVQHGGDGGLEIGAELLGANPETRVLALCHESNPEQILKGFCFGMAGFVNKQNGADEIHRAIRAVSSAQTYLCPISAGSFVKFVVAKVKQGRMGLSVLTPREDQLVKLMAQGMRSKEIAARLKISTRSVETYRFRLMKKLGCSSSAELVRLAIQKGWVRV